ncbi:uncharacterized protein LOC131666769 [Phymastichus coffea]|uniref:uncharacterized protein LOC131666769 n=1 Tax=Phymastichus coffea TaxID=108790 RepID=UPI00273B78C9|nr:uncharacterized protein LOC131666769 [Phymastichus coffea]
MRGRLVVHRPLALKMLFAWLNFISIISVFLTNCFAAEDDSSLNNRPIIGILSQEISKRWTKVYRDTYDSYIAASYVKYIESAGARVVPIWIGQDENYYKNMISKINGVLFPGGDASFNMKNGYADAGEIIYKLATRYNHNGNYFPLWGTCLGFELLTYLAANRFEHRTHCSSHHQALPLQFVTDFKNSRLFKNTPTDIINILKKENVTGNYHSLCVTKQGLIRANLTNKIRVISMNYALDHTKFISSFEHIKLPFYGVQFHPEKNPFEWIKGLNIPHTRNAVRVAHYFADFFVNETRKNHQKFSDDQEEDKALIYNFNPQFTGVNSSYFTQMYMFKAKDIIIRIGDTINSYHSRLQFTSELETNSNISFLELKLIKKNTESVEISSKTLIMHLKVFTCLFIMSILSIDAYSALTNHDDTTTNNQPIIGILSEELLYALAELYPKMSLADSYIAASYVKFVESAGAKVIPIWIDQETSYYEKILSKINGVLFPGGSLWFNDTNGYVDAGDIIYKIAKRYNDNGDYFPIWGTCLGLELWTFLEANRYDHRVRCSSQNQVLPLEFSAGFKSSRLFENATDEIINILSKENVTGNYHSLCVTTEVPNLTSKLRVISENHDKNGKKFISTLEHVKYPFYGIIFHPEKNAFEWVRGKNIPHSHNAIKTTHYFANFLVNEARKNRHKFLNEQEENRALIGNYPTYFTGKNGLPYMFVYMFKTRNIRNSTDTKCLINWPRTIHDDW